MHETGLLLREARQRAGLSQVELARKAGVTQSVVSAYESGARQPSVPMLGRLIGATGFDLEMSVVERRSVPDESLGARLKKSRKQIRQICAVHGLSNVRVFGSLARGQEKPGSDLDLLVDVAPGVGILEIGRCQAELEELLGIPADLVPASDLKPGVAHAILAEARAL